MSTAGIVTGCVGGSFTTGYRQFLEQNPVYRVSTRQRVWMYHKMGPEDCTPIIFLHGTSGTAAVFYQQLQMLSEKGYRVYSVQFPAYMRAMDWCKGFDLFLDAVKIKEGHFFGTSLSGYLLQRFTDMHPQKVLSLILCNSFADTRPFHDSSACAPLLPLMPHFMLKNLIVDAFPRLAPDIESKNATEFMASQIDDLSAADLSARLTLNCEGGNVQSIPLEDVKITLLESHDHTVLSPDLRKDQRRRYPDAKVAWLKDGGDFPFLSRPDEVAMHVEVHMRRLEGCKRGQDEEELAEEMLERERIQAEEEARLEDLRQQKLAERRQFRNPFEDDDIVNAHTDATYTDPMEASSSYHYNHSWAYTNPNEDQITEEKHYSEPYSNENIDGNIYDHVE